MDWVFGLVSGLALWGSLAFLAWGAALCLEETFGRGGNEADRAKPTAARTAPARVGGH